MSGVIRDFIWVLWDIAAVLVFLLFVHAGASRGLIRTAISFAGYALAVAAANLLSPILAWGLYDKVVKDAIRLVILNRLGEYTGSGADEIASAIPDSLTRIMDGDILETVGGALGMEAGHLVDQLIDAALREPVLSILNSILFLLLFTIVLLVVRNLSRLFRGVYKIPVIGTLNTVLGGILGVLEAAAVLLVAALAMKLLIDFSGGGWFWLDTGIMDDTYIFRVFWNAIKL